MLLPITAYGAQQQVGEKTADEDGDSSADNNADPLAHCLQGLQPELVADESLGYQPPARYAATCTHQ